MEKSVYNLAEEFVELTGSTVFLTGKAGTGKTTFLRKMREQTHKQMAVVAPTGVAAINAGGVTIHSFFQLPFTPYVPTEEGRRKLIEKQKVTSVRRKIFQSLELLVIDEISMVRADVLDAIDAVLRHYRYRRNEPFGGVQLIFIGDMYQLSPVVVGEEWELLSNYYKSPYFFHSRVLESLPMVYLELDHIFRQTNRQFIELLNQVRNNTLSPEMEELLQSRYLPSFRPKEEDGYITLTTHNQKANVINQEEMHKINNPVFTFRASVKGEFNEKNFPNDFELQLKVGAKVMFIANDVGNDRKYYNGKLGVISEMSDDEILVLCDGETEPIMVNKETWQNVRYSVNKETNQIEEEELGSYEQYPLRLAWAITIHKSQGLTFDRVVIDAGSAFASGQVYVALSRCRSLDGIVLTTPILSKSLSVDSNILEFAERKPSMSALQELIERSKMQYNELLLSRLFNLENLDGLIESFVHYFTPFADDFGTESLPYWESLQKAMDGLYQVSKRFVVQLNQIFAQKQIELLGQRIAAASAYYSDQLADVMILIENSPVVTDSRSEATDYRDRLTNIYEQVAEKRHLILGIRLDYSVTHYFKVKSEFQVPRLKLKCYAGETKQRSTIKSNHIRLYQALVALRNLICEESGLPVYMVASTKTLVEISNALPGSLETLGHIKGFGKVKLQKYGAQFLQTIEEYCGEEGIVLDEQQQTKVDFDEPEHKESKLSTLEQTLLLCRRGLSITEIAEERGLKVSTIEKHVEHWIEKDELPIDQFVPVELIPSIRDSFIAGRSITEIYSDLDGALTFGQLRMVRCKIEN